MNYNHSFLHLYSTSIWKGLQRDIGDWCMSVSCIQVLRTSSCLDSWGILHTRTSCTAHTACIGSSCSATSAQRRLLHPSLTSWRSGMMKTSLDDASSSLFSGRRAQDNHSFLHLYSTSIIYIQKRKGIYKANIINNFLTSTLVPAFQVVFKNSGVLEKQIT